MKRFLLIALLPLLALAWAGCDSDDGDDTPDAERIVGTWAAEEASLRGPLGVRIPVLDASNADDVTLAFGADGRFELVAQGPFEVEIPQTSQTLTIEGGVVAGAYELVADEQIRFTPDDLGASAAIDYDLRGNDRLDLSVENNEQGRQVLAFLLGVEANSPLLDAVTGGTVTLRK